MVNTEISAGVTRIDALKHLEQRTGLDSVKSLVNMLTQAERFGTSIAAPRASRRSTRSKTSAGVTARNPVMGTLSGLRERSQRRGGCCAQTVLLLEALGNGPADLPGGRRVALAGTGSGR